MICLTAAANTKHHGCTPELVFAAKRHTCISYQAAATATAAAATAAVAAATAAVAAAAGSSIPHVPDHLLITTYKDVRQQWNEQQQAASSKQQEQATVSHHDQQTST